MRSIRARLLVALGGTILLIGVVAGSLAFRWTFDEVIELQDAMLLQVGALAVRLKPPVDLPAESRIDADAKVVIEEIGQPYNRSSDITVSPALPRDLLEGLQTKSRSGETWRILVRNRSDGSRVAVSQRTSTRNEIARENAIRTVVPLVVLCPILLLLIGLIINVSFRSVSDLANQLDTKEPTDITILPLAGLPKELVPFVMSINRLLEKVSIMFDQQQRFIAAAAHELRTPVTALSLQAENLEHAPLSREGTDRLHVLKDGIRRVAHLLEQLLTASKYESCRTKSEPITAFDPLVKRVVADHLQLAEKRGIDLGFRRIENVSVQVEATSLSILVRNLVDNALRHTPYGGCIDVELAQDGPLVRFIIEDTGPGIPKSQIERVFEPFFRGDQSEGQGSGLGLSIVRSIVQGAAGSVIIENIYPERPSGLRVIVVFPHVGSRDGEDRTADAGRENGSQGNRA